MISFVEDVLRLYNRADPQAPDAKKLRTLMRGVKETIFGGLIRKPPTTVKSFIKEATNMERALLVRASHYQSLPNVATPEPPSLDAGMGLLPGLREIICDVIREKPRKLLPAADRPASLSVAEAVRKEVQRAFQPETAVNVAVP